MASVEAIFFLFYQDYASTHNKKNRGFQYWKAAVTCLQSSEKITYGDREP